MLMIYLQMIEDDEDKIKFEELYLTYRGLMYKVSFDILQNTQDAEDALHEAFVYVAENIKRIETKISRMTKSYLVTIVECRALNIKNAKYKQKEVSYDEARGLTTEYKGSDGLARCLSQLSGHYREVLTLKYKFGFDSKAIARMMNTSEANVRKLHQRAKEKLYKLCKEEGLI